MAQSEPDFRLIPVASSLVTDAGINMGKSVKVTTSAGNSSASCQFQVATSVGAETSLYKSIFTMQVRMNRQDVAGAAQAAVAQGVALGPAILAIQSMFSEVKLTIQTQDVNDTGITGLYPYACFARNALYSEKTPSSATSSTTLADCDFWIMDDANSPFTPVQDIKGRQGSGISAAEALATAIAASADVAALKAAFASAVFGITSTVTATTSEQTPGGYRRSLLTNKNVDMAATDWVTVGFRPKGPMWTQKSNLPDNIRFMVEFVANPNVSSGLIGDGVAVATAGSSGLLPAICIKPDSFVFNVWQETLTTDQQATSNAVRLQGTDSLGPNPFIYDFDRIRLQQSMVPTGATDWMYAGTDGICPDAVCVMFVPTSRIKRIGTTKVAGNDVLALSQDPFSFVPVTASDKGIANIQVTVGDVNYPPQYVETHLSAYQAYCDACASPEFLSNGASAPLTYSQWLKRPIYAFNTRPDGLPFYGRECDINRKGSTKVTVKFATPTVEPLTAIVIGLGMGSLRILGLSSSELSLTGFM